MTVLPIPAFNDNYLWLIHDNKEAAIVDPGDPAPVLKKLTEDNLTLKYILVTHHHMDHIGGIQTLKSKFPDAIVFGPVCGRIPCINQKRNLKMRVVCLSTILSVRFNCLSQSLFLFRYYFRLLFFFVILHFIRFAPHLLQLFFVCGKTIPSFVVPTR